MNAVIEDLPAWAVMPDGAEVPMPLMATWCRRDPWAVKLTFLTDQGDVVWLIARDLLRDGLTTEAGEGDVCLWPSDENRTALTLSSPSGQALAELDEDALRAFLDATYDAVPAGEELLWTPLDQELTELLDGSAL